mgnify:CR=1 FL=1
MLLFGYLGEIGMLNKQASIVFSTSFFIINFAFIQQNYVKDNPENKKLFIFLFVIWSLYGVAAAFPTLKKNIAYNSLDVVSKNFYGLYIYYKIINVAVV